MDPTRKAKVFELVGEMTHLNKEIMELCREDEGTRRADSISSVRDNAQKHLDMMHAMSTDADLSDLIVEIKGPEWDAEPIELIAAWDAEAEGFRLRNVPIELAAVARAIDAKLADHHWSGVVNFSWNATPEDLLRMLR